MNDLTDMSLGSLRKHFEDGAKLFEILTSVRTRISDDASRNAWIHTESDDRLRKAASKLEGRRKAGEHLPLYGIPFGVKDNIDVAGMPTTAACPDFSYLASRSARSVEKLLHAGAICIGKTNLDQFATGLSGARSPFGTCASFADPRYVSGGSSSGSAVAVAAKHVSFALGTDTGGSGRVPAGFNGVIGVKPTVGRVSSFGLVPNCPSIDCVSIYSSNVSDGYELLSAMDGFDSADPYSRQPPSDPVFTASAAFRFGRLRPDQIECFGMTECVQLYEDACLRLESIGGRPADVDFTPFAEAGRMLFEGPWIAERRASLEPFASRNSSSLLDVVARVIKASDRYTAVDVFTGMARLKVLRRQIEETFAGLDIFVVPTAPRPFTTEAMDDDPIELNNRLGYYSYGANLLDLCGVSVPNAVLSCGVPMGVTFLAPAWHDHILHSIAQKFEKTTTAAWRAIGVA